MLVLFRLGNGTSVGRRQAGSKMRAPQLLRHDTDPLEILAYLQIARYSFRGNANGRFPPGLY